MLAQSIAVLATLSLARAASYPRVDSFKGDTFLDGWEAPVEKYDNTTNGDVAWAPTTNTSIFYPTNDGKFILKVDNTSFVPYNEKRFAPKIQTKKSYPSGTVWVMDASHMPYGCSVWPALWTHGQDWPRGGEIDIMEGVNGQTANQMAIHSEGDGCYASKDVEMTGQLHLDNCSIAANGGAGCTVGDKNDNSYGAGFAAANGGAYVTEFTDEFIKIWFISRAQIPAELNADATSIDTSTLGTPTAWYANTACDIPKYFAAQKLLLTITLCGTWAGTKETLEQTCPALVGDKTCYTTYVIDDASDTYKNAYFEINYINVFSSGTPTTDSTDSGASESSGAATGGPSSPTGSGSPGNAAKRILDTTAFAWAGVGAVAAGFATLL